MRLNINKLVQTAIMLSLSSILSLIKIINLPYGGSITLLSMLPIFFISYKYNLKWGIFSGFTYGLIQLLFGTFEGSFRGLTIISVIISSVLDYIIAFTFLGFVPLFKNSIKNINISFLFGMLFSASMSLIVHIISGVLVFGSYANSFFSQEGFTLGNNIINSVSKEYLPIIYSIIYNSMYMIPEIIITVVIGMVIFNIDIIKNNIKNKTK